MFRKLCLAAAAAVTLGAAALAPSTASAWYPYHHHHYYWHHWHAYGPDYGYGCRQWVPTPWGPRLRWVC